MTLPDVLAGSVAVADPGAVPAEPAASVVAVEALDEQTYGGLVGELALPTGPDGHVDLRLLSDVQVELSVELGRITVPLRALLGLAPGSVLQLDRAADAPVDVLVGGSPVSRGEVVVIGGDFGVRVTSLVDR